MSRFRLPLVYPITDRDLSGLDHAEQVRRLAAGGASLVQLRDKRARTREFFEDAEHALEAAREAGVKLIINDRADIAFLLGADGVHLGQDDLPPREARKILGPRAIIGFSTHSVEQALAALEEPVDYIAAGPVFGTSTKESPDPVIGLEGLSAIREAVGDLPLVAIGGIGAETIPAVLAAGADSAALISALVSEPEQITQRMRTLADENESLRRG